MADALRRDDQEAALTKLGTLVGKLASDVPVVGTLAGDATGAAFRRSAYGRMKAALAIRQTEEAREASWWTSRAWSRRCSARRSSNCCAPTPSDTTRSPRPSAAYGTSWPDFRADFAARLEEAAVTVDRQEVLAGALGIRVRPDAGRSVRVVEQRVHGTGSGDRAVVGRNVRRL